MVTRRKILCFVAAAFFSLLMVATPSIAHKEIVEQGDVRLGSCDGSTAAYVKITRAEDAERLGLAGDDMAASLNNLGSGQAGAAFFPEYDNLTFDQKASVQFSLASIFLKGDTNSLKNAFVTVCFSDGTSKTVAINDQKLVSEPLGWQKLNIAPRTFGLNDADARRLDRFSVSLNGEGHMLVGNVEALWEINRPDGRPLVFGFNFFTHLHTALENCSILNGCK